MSNRFWTDKTDGVDDIVAEDFNSAFDGIVTDMDKKAEKSDIFSSRGVGVQIGENSKASHGVSIGYNSQSGQYTVAIGNDAKGDGVSIGSSAKCYDGTKYINAIQLGTGTNSEEKTAQFYDYKIMKSDGNIPVERLTELKKLSVPHTTASGYPVSVSDHLEGESLLDYKVYGNSVQDGTPTPDTPIEIQSVGDLVTDTSSPYYGKYDVPVTVCGKNLINLDQGLGTALVKNNNGTYTLTKVSASVRFSGTIDLFVPKETQVTLTLEVDEYTVTSSRAVEVLVKFSDNSAAIVNINSNRFSGSFSKDVVSCALYQNDSNADGTYTIFKNFQIEKGSTATPYEPYIGETKHIYIDEPLRKVGDYADYVDWGNQVVVRNILKFTLNGDLKGGKTTNSTDEYSGWFIENYVFSNMGTKQRSYLLCNMLPFNAKINLNLYMSIGFGGNLDLLYICLPTSMATTLSEVSTILNGAICYMPLTTPTTEPITAPDFDVPISEGMNVSSGTVIPPSSMDVTYYQDINKVITELKNAILAQGGNV